MVRFGFAWSAIDSNDTVNTFHCLTSGFLQFISEAALFVVCRINKMFASIRKRRKWKALPNSLNPLDVFQNSRRGGKRQSALTEVNMATCVHERIYYF